MVRHFELRQLLGGNIIANDGEYLGRISTNRFDSESILNPLGPFGSQLSGTSIFNRRGSYGSQQSWLSPFSQRTCAPPEIVVNGSRVCFLTANSRFTPRLDPHELLVWLESL